MWKVGEVGQDALYFSKSTYTHTPCAGINRDPSRGAQVCEESPEGVRIYGIRSVSTAGRVHRRARSSNRKSGRNRGMKSKKNKKSYR